MTDNILETPPNRTRAGIQTQNQTNTKQNQTKTQE